MSRNALTLAGLVLIAALLGGKEMAGGPADVPPVGFLLTLFSPLDSDRVRTNLAVERNGDTRRAADLRALLGHLLETTRIAD